MPKDILQLAYKRITERTAFARDHTVSELKRLRALICAVLLLVIGLPPIINGSLPGILIGLLAGGVTALVWWMQLTNTIKETEYQIAKLYSTAINAVTDAVRDARARKVV